MSDEVKPRRRYDSSRRRAQAALTREDILAAAHEAFVERGYASATVASIAQAAGVVVETVYRSFDGKAGLFRAVVEAAVAGGAARAETAPDDRPAIRALIAQPDPREQLRLLRPDAAGHPRAARPTVPGRGRGCRVRRRARRRVARARGLAARGDGTVRRAAG